ncbi:jg20236 [Pararge aegeria aegeria]|uniref:Jg20236 protein n=1 Tax=Pararge aegeria aegeria TaxID=348720 RepID=A0A8S4R2E9_9NEOP|nr:jg20236 [Pararge aegeria aegeria]
MRDHYNISRWTSTADYQSFVGGSKFMRICLGVTRDNCPAPPIMNKKSHNKKKQKRRGRNDGRNKENIIEGGCEASQATEAEGEAKPKKELSYEIKHSDVMGRYIVATKALKAGEVIIEEPALAVGPCSGCAIICLGCYRELDEANLTKCAGCKWPLCSSSCFGVGRYTGHSVYECDTLKAVPPDYNGIEDLKDSYQALMPLRCLLLKKADPDKWAALSAMEAHNSVRRARGDIFPVNDRNVVQRLKKWGLDYDDEEIHTVCGILEGTLRRREHLKLSKFFECACKRCSDPTELGTYASAFCCPRCGARVLSSAPLIATAPWRCERCPYEMLATAVQVLIKRLTEEFEQIDANDVLGYENFLTKYRNVLQESHYLCLSAKHSLSQLYGKVTEYMIHEMPEEKLHRKVEICRDLMKVFDVIEPGYSRLRGITLYELHAPLMVLTTRDFEKKAITKDNLRNRLKEIVSYLSQSALILAFEPRHTPEGLMAGAAADALRKIKTWEQIIGKIS